MLLKPEDKNGDIKDVGIVGSDAYVTFNDGSIQRFKGGSWKLFRENDKLKIVLEYEQDSKEGQ